MTFGLQTAAMSDDKNPWGACAQVVITRLGHLYDEGAFELFGHRCQYRVKPTVSNFKLKYQGKATCPGWTAIDGKSETKSRNGAIEHAITDLVNKIRDKGLVSEPDARAFLAKYKKVPSAL